MMTLLRLPGCYGKAARKRQVFNAAARNLIGSDSRRVSYVDRHLQNKNTGIPILLTANVPGVDWAAWLPIICQVGRLVRRPGGPPRQGTLS